MDGGLNVGIFVKELDALLHAPQAALHHAKNGVGDVVVLLGNLGLDVGQNGSDCFEDGDDQGSERSGS